MNKQIIYSFLPFLLLSIIILFYSCSEDGQETPEDSGWYKPAPMTSFDWDLRSDIPENTVYDAVVVDIDAFDNDKDFVDMLHAQGKKVIAYVSVGSWEEWRPDAGDFYDEVIGNDYPGWEGEKFLDIRKINQIMPIMKARFDMIKEKGFDGIEPDNIDLHAWTAEETGFDIDENDVITYAKLIAQEAHDRGLSVGQKNASDLSEELVDSFDWILTEDAFYYGFQNEAVPYIDHNKAVFAVEYTDKFTASYLFAGQVCEEAAQLQYTAILKNRELDAFVYHCPD